MRAVNFQANTGEFESWAEEAFREIERASRDFDPNALDFLGTPAQGDVIYRGATNWARLPAGTSGYVLSSLGTGANPLWIPNREVLTANRTYYVRTDGSDSNTGLVDSAGGGFLTIQKAVDVACALDLSIYSVTIVVRSGTFGAIVLKSYIGGGTITITGDTTTPSNVVTGTITQDGVVGKWLYSGLKPGAITVTNGSVAEINGTMEYPALASGLFHISVAVGSQLRITSNGTNIVGGASGHIAIQDNATVFIGNQTYTLTGTPAFPLGFVYCDADSVIRAPGVTFSGSATGKKFLSSLNSTVYTGGAGYEYFPGDTGNYTQSFGGVYL